MQNSMLASLGKPLWRLLEAHYIDADALFKRQGLDPSLIREPRTRYSYDLLCKAWVEAATITGKEHLGLELGKYFTPLDLNALGVTFLSSAMLQEALERLDRYETLLNPSLDFTIAQGEDRLDLLAKVKNVPEEASRITEDCRASVIIYLARMSLGQSLDPVEVAFTYPEPNATGEHLGMFRCSALFSQPVSRISFSMADASRPFPDANRELAINNDRFLDEMMKDLSSPDIVTLVKKTIVECLPSGAPSEEKIARRALVSSRTLQRRLADENTNFRTLLLQVRKHLAEKYISDQTMPIAEISYMLGFTDTSSFSRAFKKWTGDPPGVFRANLPD